MKQHPLPKDSKLSYYMAFCHTERALKGNCAAVVLLQHPLQDQEMLDIAKGLAQPATSFLIHEKDNNYAIRWFAPSTEIGLCGHGTLAAAQFLKDSGLMGEAIFNYPKGSIIIDLSKALISMEFDSIISRPLALAPEISTAFNIAPVAHLSNSNKDLLVFENEKQIAQLKPDHEKLAGLKAFGYVVTAAADNDDFDFVSRTILPKLDEKEDQATGSAHVILTAYWSERLKKSKLKAKQLSTNGGYFICEQKQSQVVLSGYAVNTDF